MTEQPNILVIMTDQQKVTASHLYGNTFCQTPNMARLANEGYCMNRLSHPNRCVFRRASRSGLRNGRIRTAGGAMKP